MTSKPPVRVRFAPSPTGQLHVGNARTALFNWLFARQSGGTMVLRIEDTDLDRSEGRFESQLIEDLRWLSLDWDEGPDVGGPWGPYRQSDRLAMYHEHAERLLSEGKAYLCFCSEEELQREREEAMAENRQPVYSGRCRKLDPKQAAERRRAGECCAVRLEIPDHAIRFHDMVRGTVEFPNEVISDLIIVRSSGMPVYNYVVVVDDALMQITHVIRGDDHLSNTPKQVALYEALGWPTPEFAHLSTILGPDRTRLSKRHGATSIASFREQGVLPEALSNYLALLGWAPSGGNREIFKTGELIQEFDLRRVTPSSAVFDPEKLDWLNRHFIKERLKQPGSGREELIKIALESFAKAGYLDAAAGEAPPAVSSEIARWFERVIELLAPSVSRLQDLAGRARFIFEYDAQAALRSAENQEVLRTPTATAVMRAFAAKVSADEDARNGRLSAERFELIVNEVKGETGTKGKDLFHPIRIVLTGSHSGPDFDKVIPIFEDGSHLALPQHVRSVRERAEAFIAVLEGAGLEKETRPQTTA